MSYNTYSDSLSCLSICVVGACLLIIQRSSDYYSYGSAIRRGYDKDIYRPFCEKDQMYREILCVDLDVKNKPLK